MTRSINNIEKTAAALDERLAALNAELSATRELAINAQMKAATSGPGVQEEADRLGGEVQRLERAVASTREALAAVDEAGVVIAEGENAKAAARAKAALDDQVRACRKVVQVYDAALSEAGVVFQSLREEIAKLWQMADGPTRTNELGELPTFIANLTALAHERLASGGVLISRNALFDRDAPPVSVEEHLDKILDLILARPGRPKKEGE